MAVRDDPHGPDASTASGLTKGAFLRLQWRKHAPPFRSMFDYLLLAPSGDPLKNVRHHPAQGTTMSTANTEVLTPFNSQLIFIDQQPQMAFGVQSIDRQTLKNNTVGLAKAARIFNVPTTITTVETESFSGHTYPELLAVFPDAPLLERTSMNSWDDQKVRDALKNNGRNKIIVSGLWTEVCNTTFALSAMHDAGYEIYMVADASGGTTKEAHDYAMQRMIQAGVVPVTWQQVLLEWQRDWNNRATYDAVMELVKEHSGAYGMGVDYAYTMVHKAPERVKHGPTLAPVAAPR
jgi:nicotinamidase-related amidase